MRHCAKNCWRCVTEKIPNMHEHEKIMFIFRESIFIIKSFVSKYEAT